MSVKARKEKRQVNVENQAINLLSKEELSKKIDVVRQIKRGLILQIKTDFFNRLAMV